MTTARLEGHSDSLTAQLVEELIDLLQAGDGDAQDFIAAHPEQAAALERLLPALRAMADLSATLPQGDAAESLGGTLGDFRIVREVGRGGMGIVYEAEQLSLRRRVALKVLPFAAALDPRQLQRFHNEALAAASLHHEHIVPVHAIGCERGVHFYAMQFVDGATLAEAIAAIHAGPGAEPALLPAAETQIVAELSTARTADPQAFYRRAAALIAQAAGALEHAHSVGIVHRDIKPGNLLIEPSGKLLIGDFGLARFGPENGLTMSGDLLGTLRYMAPEQALGRHGVVDHRADIYALGATLYELLAGRPVVAAAERAEILRQIAGDDAVPLRKHDRSIPVELETITLKCLQKEPGERYACAGDLSTDLQLHLKGEPIHACPPSAASRCWRFARRHQVWMGAAVAVSAALVLGLTISIWQALRATRAENLATTNEARALSGETLAGQEHNKAQLAVEAELRQRDLTRQNLRDAMLALQQTYVRVARRLPEQKVITDDDRQILDEIIRFYEKFANRNAFDAELRPTLIGIFKQVADVHEQLGRPDKAQAALRKAVQLGDEIAQGPLPVGQNGNYRLQLNECRDRLARILDGAEATRGEAHDLWRDSIADLDRLADEHPGWKRPIESDLVKYLRNQSVALARSGQLEEARLVLRRAESLLQIEVARPDARRGAHFDLATVATQRARLQDKDSAEAQRLREKVIGIYEQLLRKAPQITAYRELLAYTLDLHGEEHERLGDIAEAAKAYERALAELEAIVSKLPGNVLHQDFRTQLRKKLAAVHADNERPAGAESRRP